jgi:hypothetical protein
MTRTVFWSWQSDLDRSITKDFIKAALEEALEKASSELQLESADRVELDHDTKGEAGLVEIVKTIFGKIDTCDVFVADITPIATTSPHAGQKQIPNPNVMIELGYALRELGHKRVITVANLAFGGRPEELPFDLRHRRGAITYLLERNANSSSRKHALVKLVKELTGALTLNLSAPREDRLVKYPQPKLSLEFSDDMAEIALVRQNRDLKGVPTLDEIKVQTPLKSEADQAIPESAIEAALAMLQAPGPLSRDKPTKPFREWTKEELDGYNESVQRYYGRYTDYLEAAEAHWLYLQRAIRVQLILVNKGTRPAEKVRCLLRFPPDVLAYEDADMPKRPAAPSPPVFAPYGRNTRAIVTPIAQELFEKDTPRIAGDRGSIEFRIQELPHHHQRTILPFTVLLGSQKDIRGFGVEYIITDDHSPHRKEGKLRFEVELATS